jgi:hypothetical protein
MYCYSIDYDKAMLNFICKLIELEKRGKIQIDNFNETMRELNDFLINKDQVYYFRINGEFWTQSLKTIEKQFPMLDDWDKKYNLALELIKSKYTGRTLEFLEKYHLLLGKSKLFKQLTICEVPKIYYYYNVAVNGKIKPSIGLKNLQLLHEGTNQKFDFNQYKTAQEIKDAGLWDVFISYSKNDVQFLKTLFLDKPMNDILKRMYAVKAVKMINPDFEISDDAIYSENNTNLITEILKIDNPNKDIDVDYTQYINTPYEKFNKFVSFVNDNKHIANDRQLKKLYCSKTGVEYANDDTVIFEDDKLQYLINTIDTIDYKGTLIKYGMGGLHAAKDNYIGENLIHLDYDSQYPSTILQYRELFGQIINVDLYEAVYNMRIKYKKLKKTLTKGTPEYREADLIEGGLKLILNTCYGLINSEYKIAIACKTLGRFICLKGQSLLLNLCSKLKDSELINGNTDGDILKVGTGDDVEQIMKDDIDGYYKLSRKDISYMIQSDVNTYIKVVNGDVEVKGRFKNSVKGQINQSDNLSCNLENALNILGNKPINIIPIVFHKKINLSETNQRYYLTTSEHGVIAIKNNKKPVILVMNDEAYYFTPDKSKASLEVYKEMAEKTLEKIKTFSLNTKSKPKAFIEQVLDVDTDENIKIKRKVKRDLCKVFDKDSINLGGYKGNVKINSHTNKGAIQKFIHYTMTAILQSIHCNGFNLTSNEKYIVINVKLLNKKEWQICKPFLHKLKESETFQTWNNDTCQYNRVYVFKNESNINFEIEEALKPFINVSNEQITLWSLDEKYQYKNELKNIEVLKNVD